MKVCLVNGIKQNHIDIESRGLAYGDGLFTTAKIVNGEIQFLPKHIERLIAGCIKLKISPPSVADLENQLTPIAKNYSLAVLKIIISAKSGGRGYKRSIENSHDVIVMIYDFPLNIEYKREKGISLGVSRQRIGISPMLSGLKHLNRLEQVLLTEELTHSDFEELLVMNINNDVIEVTSANVFFIINNEIYTPDISHSGVNGIMRQVILNKYTDIIVKSISLEEIEKAQSIFICNCVMGIIPISQYNDCRLSLELPLELSAQLQREV